MEPTKQDAEAMLKGAGAIETAVRARTPQEYPLYVAMGVTTVALGLAHDLYVADGVAGAVATTLLLGALAVTVGTNLRYLGRYRRVRMRRTPNWVEWALGLWSVAALVSLGILLDGVMGFSFSVGGIVGAVPFLLWAERLRRTA